MKKREQSERELVARVAPFLHLPCVGGKLYLGSMFYMDFGATFSTVTRKGASVEVGLMTLSVRNHAWHIFRGQELVVSAESVSSDEFHSKVLLSLLGRSIVSILLTESSASIGFDDGWRIAIEACELDQDQEDAAEFALPDGRLVTLDHRLEPLNHDEIDSERAKQWQHSKLRH